MPKITPSFYREVVGLVVRLPEQKISMERLKLERARFELDVADLLMKHLDNQLQSRQLRLRWLVGKWDNVRLRTPNLCRS